MAIKAIVFDLGRTLVPLRFEVLEPRLRGCRAEAERLCQRVETGELAAEAFQTEMCDLTGLEPAAFGAWWNSIFGPHWLIPEDWIRALMGEYRVGLLSNTNPLHFDFLSRDRPLLREFDFRILSHEVGAAKPSSRIYAAAEIRAECAPEEIFFLDDIPEFVAAARRRGWRAEVFVGAGGLDAQWARHGIHRAAEPRAVAAHSREKVKPVSPEA